MMIKCHGHQCRSRIQTNMQDRREVRRVAREHGWLTVICSEAIWDFCPEHTHHHPIEIQGDDHR
jgi:hypothetical protein